MIELDKLLAVVGLVCGCVSAIFLAVSLSRWVTTISWAVDAVNTSLMTVASLQDAVVFTGIETHIDRDKKRAERYVVFGLWLLAVSFLLQGIAIIVDPIWVVNIVP